MSLPRIFIKHKLNKLLKSEYNDSEDLLDLFDNFDLKTDSLSLYECSKNMSIIYNGKEKSLNNFLSLSEIIYTCEMFKNEEISNDPLNIKNQEFDRSYVYDILVKEYLIPALNDKDKPKYILEDFIYNIMLLFINGNNEDIEILMDVLIDNECDELIERILVNYFCCETMYNYKGHKMIISSINYFIKSGQYDRIGNILSKSNFEFTYEEYLSDYEVLFNLHNNYRLCVYYYFHMNEEDNMIDEDKQIEMYYELFSSFENKKTHKGEEYSIWYDNNYVLKMIIEEVVRNNNVLAKCCALEKCWDFITDEEKIELIKSVFISQDKELIEWVYYMCKVLSVSESINSLLREYEEKGFVLESGIILKLT